jgi:hypothetical protein
MVDKLNGRLQGELFTECASWIWEQLQDEGVFIQGELIELILKNERELGIQDQPTDVIVTSITSVLNDTNAKTLDAGMIAAVLSWEDEFLGLANIPRAES